MTNFPRQSPLRGQDGKKMTGPRKRDLLAEGTYTYSHKKGGLSNFIY
jgi:hypothetical protein